MQRRLLFAGTLLAVAARPESASAQKIDLVSASAQYLPSKDLPDQRPAKAQVSSYDVAVNVPLPLGEKTFLIPGVGYHADGIAYHDAPPTFVDLRVFHSIEVAALFVQLLPKDWSVSARVAPGIAGDFAGLDTGMLRFNALAMASHSFSERFVLGGGAMTTFSFGSFLPLPAAYVSWKAFDGFHLEGFLPAFLQASYTIANRVRLGVMADFNGNEYAVRDGRIRGVYPCVPARVDNPATAENETIARPAACLDNLAYSVGAAGLTAGVRLFSSVWFQGLFGHSFFRRTDLRNVEKDPVPGGEQEIPNGLMVRAGVVWRLPTSE